MKSELTLDQFKGLLDSPFGRKALRIGLLGGEPFLNRNIFEFIRILNERRVVSTVVTNCQVIRSEQKEEFRRYSPTALGLSLYDNNRDSVGRVASMMNDLKKLYWIQTIIRADRLQEMEQAIRFSIDHGCKHLQLSNYYPTDRSWVGRVIFDDNREFSAIRDELARKYRRKISIRWPPAIPSSVRDPHASPPTKKHCEMPSSYVHVDNAGNLGGCCMRVPDGEKFGNLFTEGDTWNRAFYQELRSQMSDDMRAPDDHCRYCECWVSDLYGV